MQGTFALSYLVQLALTRIVGFFRHWYIDGIARIRQTYRLCAGQLEGFIATRTMLHLLFTPLYGDYSIVGRIIGPIFRVSRLIVGVVMHIIMALLFFICGALWAALPLLLIFYATGLISR